MAEINDLDVTDANNTARMPENMAPSAVNDGVRALEGILARWHKDTNGSLVSTGSANAYVLAANQTLSAYYDGLTLTFETNFANTDAATLNVDAVGAQSIVWPDGSALSSGDLPSGAKVTVRYDNDNTRWLLVSVPKRGALVSGTEQATTSGASIDTTGIPAWPKRITYQFVGVSTSGTSIMLLQLGISSGPVATGYLSATSEIAAAVASTNATTGFAMSASHAADRIYHGTVTLTLEDSASNTWVATINLARSDAAVTIVGAGAKSLSGTLDRIRLTTVGGTDTFDAGEINILYE